MRLRDEQVEGGRMNAADTMILVAAVPRFVCLSTRLSV